MKNHARNLMAALFVANVVLDLASLFILPEKVAIHFRAGGAPDSWAPVMVNALIFLGINIMMFFIFLLGPEMLGHLPPRLIHLPHSGYWLKKENIGEAKARAMALTYEFCAVILAFLLVVMLLVIKANLSRPVKLDENLFLPAFAALMLYNLIWLFRLLKAFKLPRKQG